MKREKKTLPTLALYAQKKKKKMVWLKGSDSHFSALSRTFSAPIRTFSALFEHFFRTCSHF